MWNRKHNDGEKISGHTFIHNWKVVQLPIKVHPSADYCNSGGLQCQYLRFKDADGKTGPFCAWNFEQRGIDSRDRDTGKSLKGPLQYDDKQKNFIRKARFCRRLSERGYNTTNTWENTTTVDDPDPLK